jgi:hypothetical protein
VNIAAAGTFSDHSVNIAAAREHPVNIQRKLQELEPRCEDVRTTLVTPRPLSVANTQTAQRPINDNGALSTDNNDKRDYAGQLKFNTSKSPLVIHDCGILGPRSQLTSLMG